MKNFRELGARIGGDCACCGRNDPDPLAASSSGDVHRAAWVATNGVYLPRLCVPCAEANPPARDLRAAHAEAILDLLGEEEADDAVVTLMQDYDADLARRAARGAFQERARG